MEWEKSNKAKIEGDRFGIPTLVEAHMDSAECSRKEQQKKYEIELSCVRGYMKL